MYRKTHVECVPLTLELAQQFAQMTPLPGERELLPKRIAFLQRELSHGRFVGPEWVVGHCMADNAEYRVEGQHSSKMLSNLPEGCLFPSDLLVTVTHFSFDSMYDSADLFNLFDNPRSVRNNEDMMGVYQARVPGILGYSRKFLVNIANGLHEYEAQRQRRGAKDAVLFGPRDRGLYFDHPERPDFVVMTHWLAEFRELKNRVFLTKPVIVDQMLLHRAAAPEVARDFWKYVFTESHPDVDHETRGLAEFFRELLAVAAKPKIDQGLFRKKTGKAWKLFKGTTELTTA